MVLLLGGGVHPRRPAQGPEWHALQEAYTVLRDPAARTSYDQWLQSDIAVSYGDWLRAGPARAASAHFAAAAYQPPAATRALPDPADDGGGAPDSKRPRVDDAGVAPAGNDAQAPLDQFREANTAAAAALGSFRDGEAM